MHTLRGRTGLRLEIIVPPGRTKSRARTLSSGSNPRSTSASPSVIFGLLNPPISTKEWTTPPRWAIPWISPAVTCMPLSAAISASRLVAVKVPCPPTPVKNMRVLLILFSLVHLNMLADLYAQHAAGALARIDMHFFVLNIEGRAGQGVNAFHAPVATVQNFGLLGLFLAQHPSGIQRTRFLGDQHPDAFFFFQGLKRLHCFFVIERLDLFYIGDAATTDNHLDVQSGLFPGRSVAQARVGLVTGHGRSAVVHNHQKEVMLVVYCVNQT